MGQKQADGTIVDGVSWSTRASWATVPVSTLHDSVQSVQDKIIIGSGLIGPTPCTATQLRLHTLAHDRIDCSEIARWSNRGSDPYFSLYGSIVLFTPPEPKGIWLHVPFCVEMVPSPQAQDVHREFSHVLMPEQTTKRGRQHGLKVIESSSETGYSAHHIHAIIKYPSVHGPQHFQVFIKILCKCSNFSSSITSLRQHIPKSNHPLVEQKFFFTTPVKFLPLILNLCHTF